MKKEKATRVMRVFFSEHTTETETLIKSQFMFFFPCFVTDLPSDHKALRERRLGRVRRGRTPLGRLVLWGWRAAAAAAGVSVALRRCAFGEGFKRGERESLRGLVEEDAALDGLAADGALAHSVPAQLAGAVAAHEDHVLQPVQTHRTHRLQITAHVGVVIKSRQLSDTHTHTPR